MTTVLAGTPNLKNYDWIVVNTSAGKDSQAMTEVIHEQAWLAKVLERLVLVHCDLGRVEWPGTLELAEEHARHYKSRFEVVRRAQVGDLLAEIKRRGKWPSPTERYCTSYYKREQVSKLHTRLAKETARSLGRIGRRPARILNCLGFRAEESTRRKKLPPWSLNDRQTTKTTRRVEDYLPIHDWPEQRVWDTIEKAGTRYHPAYDLGMRRLSCQFCIFAPKGQLMIAARNNPKLFQEYVDLEKEMGHTFRVDLALADVQQAIKDGEDVPEDDGAWNM